VKKNPLIVVITYNRPKSLQRLLSFISSAQYNDTKIDIVISIDYQDSDNHEEVIEISNNFIWNQGNKKVIVHDINLGLRKHVISCGNLVGDYDSLIMLEDDLVVSPYFYLYAQEALTFYSNDDKIAGISLYSHVHNYCSDLPFSTIPDSYDVYFLQIAASWGQAWTKLQWTKFYEWYSQNPSMLDTDNIPTKIKRWPESSWVKYFIKYLVTTDRYFVYPKISYTSNMSDPGTHHKNKEYTYSVPFFFKLNSINSKMTELKNSFNVYDSYFEPEVKSISNLILSNKTIEVSTIDIYGIKDLSFYKGKYVISSKKLLRNNPLQSFGVDLKPAILNVFYGISGDVLHLAKAEDFDQSVKLDLTESDWDYYYGKKRIRDYVRILLIKIRKKYIG